MKKVLTYVCLGLSLLVAAGCVNEKPVYKTKSAGIEERVKDLVGRMTLSEKIDMLSGEGFDTRANTRLDIPSLKMADGPAGIRRGRATAFPAPIAMAATWNRDLMNRTGRALGNEIRGKGRNFFLGPCVNIVRHVLAGRNFESFGEDPFLAAEMAVPYIQGVQKQGVHACVKHFACNNQEWKRSYVSVDLTERALREIYLPAYKAAVQRGNVHSVMAAYNKFRGHYCSESDYLLNEILKKEWGFKGFVVSDWGATYSTEKAALSGLDLEMPWGIFFKDSLDAAVTAGRIKESVINDKAERLLRVRFASGIFDRGINDKPVNINTQLNSETALRIAEESIVLLQNRGGLLPLNRKKIKTLAVIGYNGAKPRTGGGGSSQVVPLRAVSVLEGLREFAGNDVNIVYSPGIAESGDVVPLAPAFCSNPKKKIQGWLAEYYKTTDFEGKPVLTRNDEDIDFVWGYDAPDKVLHRPDDRNVFSVRWTATLVPPQTGEYIYHVVKCGKVKLTINGKTVIDAWSEMGSSFEKGKIFLNADEPVDAVVEYAFEGGISHITLGWHIPETDPVEEAVEIAKKADAVIICTGLSNRFESESFDRISMDLPMQTELIKAISAVNRNVVIINQTGSAVSMNTWKKYAAGIIQAWYPGQEGGTAVANIVFGTRSPSGKLPCSFIASLKDTPAMKGYKDPNLNVKYEEGIFVGYRYLEKNRITPAFPFGHGLSYTSFKYENMRVEQHDDTVYVTIDITNTGKMTGGETVQIYIKDIECTVERPEKELKGFDKVFLEPGQKKTVCIQLDESAFSFYDQLRNRWTVEPGEFNIMAGSSSGDIRLSEKIVL